VAVAWTGAVPASEGGRTVATLEVAFAVVPTALGTLLAYRRPANGVGWLVLAFGAVGAVVQACRIIAWQPIAAGDPLTGGPLLAAMVSQLLWPLSVGLLPLVLLLFPDGRLPSQRWRPFAIALAALPFATMPFLLLAPGEMGVATGADNPYGLAGTAGTVATVVGITLVIGILAGFIPAGISLFLRRRRADTMLRLQLRWFAWAVGINIAVLVLTGSGALIDDPLLNAEINGVTLSLLWVAIAIAVLRYRLYDIDRIISRTVSYAAVTVVVVAVYLGGVTMITALTSPVTGESPVAVAAATLAAAAVFGPARRRIQSAVDHRFNRARYDAEQIAAAYRARLRDELDLASLRSELLRTVEATMQPSTSALWLPPTVGAQR
ncbi:MAG TPA: hypothetical protein VM307_10500, partial [Egibacteraceae bacterium]|nr:hypothetical protein [Egibacteraceae bacterium]